jgi:hypothetical protein
MASAATTAAAVNDGIVMVLFRIMTLLPYFWFAA